MNEVMIRPCVAVYNDAWGYVRETIVPEEAAGNLASYNPSVITFLKTPWYIEAPLKWITLEEFHALPEYSMTIPTGKTIGKRWKGRVRSGPCLGAWYICEYTDIGDPTGVGIETSRIAVDGREGPEAGVNRLLTGCLFAPIMRRWMDKQAILYRQVNVWPHTLFEFDSRDAYAQACRFYVERFPHLFD